MTDKNCLIIGAGDGLGHALAKKFAQEGYDLALISRTKGGSQIALEAATKAKPGGRHVYYSGDATQPESLSKTVAKIEADSNGIEILIYNARGDYTLKEPIEMTFSDLEEIYRLEVVGAFAATKILLPSMLQRNEGTIIYSSATAAFRGSGTNPLYAIGKFGLRALSQSLAKAYSKKGIHIAHIRLDCTLDVPLIRQWYGDNFVEEETANVDDVAESYWWVHQQPKSAWSNEVELRPYTENWSF